MSRVGLVSRWSGEVLRFAAMFAIALAVAAVFSARGDNHDTTYHACLYAGSLSQVSTTPPANCGRGTPISWASGGQAGVSIAYAEAGANTNIPFAYTDATLIPVENLVTVVSQDVPAGNYIANMAVFLQNAADENRQIACVITSSLSPSVQLRVLMDLEPASGINQAVLPLTTDLTLDADGAIEVLCGSFTGDDTELGEDSEVNSIRAFLTVIPAEQIE